MSINILGGVAKGFTLATPHESITRPTSVLLKRRLFDFFQSMQEYYFYDLCAGSGSMGFEALSRGADKSVMVESNIKAFKILQTNAKNFSDKFPQMNVEVKKMNYEKWLDFFFETYKQDQESILFFDPPYERISMYEDFFNKVQENNFKGIVIVEACRQKTMAQKEFESLFGKPDRNYQQGTSFLYLYDYNK